MSDAGRIAAEIRKRRPPGRMRTRIAAVDGPGGAGKTTFAAALAEALDAAPIVHTDDFASWEQPLDWWPRLVAEVLEPLAANEPAAFVPNSWGGPERERIVIEPCDFLVLEGVTASRRAFAPYLSYAVWVDAPRELRLRRGLERDGVGALAQWEAWMAAEDRYLEDEAPHLRADAVVDDARA
jgi:uridine kinase